MFYNKRVVTLNKEKSNKHFFFKKLKCFLNPSKTSLFSPIPHDLSRALLFSLRDTVDRGYHSSSPLSKLFIKEAFGYLYILNTNLHTESARNIC